MGSVRFLLLAVRADVNYRDRVYVTFFFFFFATAYMDRHRRAHEPDRSAAGAENDRERCQGVIEVA